MCKTGILALLIPGLAVAGFIPPEGNSVTRRRCSTYVLILEL